MEQTLAIHLMRVLLRFNLTRADSKNKKRGMPLFSIIFSPYFRHIVISS